LQLGELNAAMLEQQGVHPVGITRALAATVRLKTRRPKQTVRYGFLSPRRPCQRARLLCSRRFHVGDILNGASPVPQPAA
jgi:hypothetical protein